MKKSILLLTLLSIGCCIYSQKWEKIPKTEKTSRIFFLNEKTGWRIEMSSWVYKTTDGGKTWSVKIREQPAYIDENTPKPEGIYEYPYGYRVSDVFFLNETTGWASILGIQGGILTSADGGNTWLDHKKPIEMIGVDNGEPDMMSVKDMYFKNNKTGWACGDFYDKGKPGLYKTDNGGVNWHIVHCNIYYDSTNTYDEETEHFHYIPDQSCLDKMFFVDSLTGWTIGDRLFIYTKDGGKTWARDTSRLYKNLSDIFFLNRNVGWIAEGEQLLQTKDGGKSYETIYEDSSYLSITSIHFFNEKNGIIGVGKDPVLEMDGSVSEEGKGYLLETLDGGQNWKIILKENCAFKDIQYMNNSIIYVGTRSGIYKYVFEI